MTLCHIGGFHIFFVGIHVSRNLLIFTHRTSLVGRSNFGHVTRIVCVSVILRRTNIFMLPSGVLTVVRVALRARLNDNLSLFRFLNIFFDGVFFRLFRYRIKLGLLQLAVVATFTFTVSAVPEESSYLRKAFSRTTCSERNNQPCCACSPDRSSGQKRSERRTFQFYFLAYHVYPSGAYLFDRFDHGLFFVLLRIMVFLHRLLLKTR